jgi:hypothetical protein
MKKVDGVEHVARMGEMSSVHKVLVGRPERKGPLGGRRTRLEWDDNIKMDLRSITCED